MPPSTPPPANSTVFVERFRFTRVEPRHAAIAEMLERLPGVRVSWFQVAPEEPCCWLRIGLAIADGSSLARLAHVARRSNVRLQVEIDWDCEVGDHADPACLRYDLQLETDADQDAWGSDVDVFVWNLQRLLRRETDIDARDPELGQTELYRRVADIEAVRRLLAQGANPNIATHAGETPLTFAADHGLVDVARLLLAAGADAHYLDREVDRTVLFYAAGSGSVALVELLLNTGVDAAYVSPHGQTARGIALANGHQVVADLLRARGG